MTLLGAARFVRAKGLLLLCFAVLVGAVAMRVYAALSFYPTSFVDEVVYVEPAVNWAENGRFAAPGFSEQMVAKGLGSLDESYHLTVPVAMWVRAVIFKVCGIDGRVRRLVDVAFFGFLLAAFYMAGRRITDAQTALFATTVLGLNKWAWWVHPGRADTLACAFGLLACCFALRMIKCSDLTRIFSFLAGLMLGLSGLTHQLGGVTFGFLCLMIIGIGMRRNLNLGLRNGLYLCLGTLFVLLLYLASIIPEYTVWKEQMAWLLSLKKQLNKDFSSSLYSLLKHTVLRNPWVLVLILCGFWKSSHTDRKVMRMLFAYCVGWSLFRSSQFEGYNYSYSLYFWVLICGCLLLGLQHGDKWAKGNVIVLLLPMLCILNGLFSNYSSLIEVSLLNNGRQARAIAEAFRETVPNQAKCLVDCTQYLDLRRPNIHAMVYHENVDLRFYEYVAMSRNPPTVVNQRDQYFDVLTPQQEQTLGECFDLVKCVEPELVSDRFALSHYRAKTTGLYIYKRK